MPNAAVENITYPYEPSQTPRAPVMAQGEYTGMVYCPRKTAPIAIMKCGEFQARDGCAAGCKYAATKAQLDDIAAALKSVRDRGRYSDMKAVCAECGEQKFKRRRCKSAECAPEVNQNSRHSYAPRANSRRAAAMDDLPNCMTCGKEKLSYAGSLCKGCAVKAWSAKRPRRHPGVCPGCEKNKMLGPITGKCATCYERGWRQAHRA